MFDQLLNAFKFRGNFGDRQMGIPVSFDGRRGLDIGLRGRTPFGRWSYDVDQATGINQVFGLGRQHRRGYGAAWERGYVVEGYGPDARYGAGEGDVVVGPYRSAAMAEAYGRAAGAEPWRRTMRREMYGEGVVMADPRTGQPLPRHSRALPPGVVPGVEYDVVDGRVVVPPHGVAPQAQGAPMDIRPQPHAAVPQTPRAPQAQPQTQPQRQPQPLREPSAQELKKIQDELRALHADLPPEQTNALTKVLQTNLERAGFGARTDASKYSKVDGIAGPLTARGFAHYAQSRGLDPNNVHATLDAMRQEFAGQIRGGQPMRQSEAVQPNVSARHAQAELGVDPARGA